MKISVITPSYHSVKTIERAILSVTIQNYPNLEHIVIDGGSNDGTVDILKKYPHINWISEPDKGQSDAMNKGFKLSTGQIVVYLNADDEFLPGIFNKIATVFRENKGNKRLMIICDLKFLYEGGIEKITKPSPFLRDIINPVKLAFPYNPISYFYSREVQHRIGNFPDRYHYAMDYWFLIKAYMLSTVIYVPELAGIFHNYDNKTSDRTSSYIEVLGILLTHIRKHNKLFFLNNFWLKANLIRFRLILKKMRGV